jgi:hypothetical protein
MTDPTLRRPSPYDALNEDSRKKAKRIGGSSSSASSPISVQATTPGFLGGFVRSCGGGPSSYKQEDGGTSSASSASAGCFGIRIGGGNTHNNNADDNDDPTAVIAQAMTQLSVQEREQAYEDMHGVSETVQETPELIATSLRQMEQCLQNIHHKPAYNLAITIRADYVQDRTFRLMFLRAVRFDPELAANRLIKLLDWKLKIFGEETLCKWHIGLEDLDDDSRFMLESGLVQVLPERDSRGRVIFVISPNNVLRFYRNSQSFLQMAYYCAMIVAEDETNQMSGVVSVSYGLGQDKHAGLEIENIWPREVMPMSYWSH